MGEFFSSNTKSGIDTAVISRPVDTLHTSSLQGFRGLLKIGLFKPDLVSISINTGYKAEIR